MQESVASKDRHNCFSRTTWVSRHQKGWTILDFNEARDDGVTVASAWWITCKIICNQTDNHVRTSSVNFSQARCSFWLTPNQQRQSTEGYVAMKDQNDIQYTCHWCKITIKCTHINKHELSLSFYVSSACFHSCSKYGFTVNREPLDIFYRLHVLPATQPTVPKHRKKLQAGLQPEKLTSVVMVSETDTKT